MAISARPLWNLDESPSKEFFVKLDRMGVKVILRFTNQVPLGLWFRKPTTAEELATFHQIKQSIEIIVKHGMGTNLVTVGKNPDTFFLPDHCQMQLMRGGGRGPNPFASYYVSSDVNQNNNNKIKPWVLLSFFSSGDDDDVV